MAREIPPPQGRTLRGYGREIWWVVSWLVRVGSRHPVHVGPAWVSLVIDSRFLAVDPYSSWVRSIGPEGYVPFFEEKPWVITG